MIIDIARMKPDGELFRGEEPPCIFEFEDGGHVSVKEPVKYDLKGYIVTNELIVEGKISVKALFVCSRCAEPFGIEINEPSFHFSMAVDEGTESVDLTDEIREAMLLAFPSYPVCSSGCRGLCAQCGINLNDKSCNCKQASDVSWGELNNLKL